MTGCNSAWHALRRAGRLVSGLLALALLVPLGTLASPAFRDLGPLVVSKAAGYRYAYAPALIREGNGYRILYCSTGDGVAWDWIRTSTSPDGQRWAPPVALLRPAAGERERAACDPSLVRYQAPDDPEPFFYLFYSGSPNGTGAAIFVARALQIAGPYAKWTGADWQVDGVPEPVIRPATPHPDGSGFYGAGQPSVIVHEGRMRIWFTDDTGCTPACPRVLSAQAVSPTAWGEATPTNVAATSVEVKFDDVRRRYAMWAISGPYTFSAYLVRWHSDDGVAWSRPDIVIAPTSFVHYAHNLGVAGDAHGHVGREDLLLAFGAPRGVDCGACWAEWDLRGVRLLGNQP